MSSSPTRRLFRIAGLLSLFVAALLPAGCDVAQVQPGLATSIEDLLINSDFDYSTVQTVDLDLRALTNANEPIPEVRLKVYASDPDTTVGVLLDGLTDRDGRLSASVTVPSYQKELWVTTDYLGLVNKAVVPILGGRAEFTLGGSTPMPTGIRTFSVSGASASFDPLSTNAPTYSYLGSWNSQGVPNYLLPDPDYIDVSFLQTVNASLPEQNPVPTAHPEYLATGNEMDVRLQQEADVWVTFVHEGAGWKNALAFYTYDLDAPPQSVADVTGLTIIFPNVSYAGSGGGLQSGQKVRIGRFAAGTGIGWALIANGWNGSGVGSGSHIVYSEPGFNPETNPSLRQHSVLLHDPDRDLLLLGFEDMRRDSGSDNDFNDAIFFVTANPYSAIEMQSIQSVDLPSSGSTSSQPVTSTVYYPSSTAYSTLAFEDLWPGRGDYDFNDLVVDVRYEFGQNSQNQVVEIVGEFVIKAVGAGYHNGFAVSFPFSPTLLSRVEGNRTGSGLTTYASNGLESGQSQAVLIVFEDAYDVITRPSGYFINTQREAPHVEPVTVRVTLQPARPLTTSEVGAPPFNPFLIANGERGREIHLPDRAPTAKVDPSFFGQSNDNSAPGSGRTYKTHKNLPWALHLPVSFDYPTEQSSVMEAHLEFAPWAESSGLSAQDWYLSKPSYRNPLFIY